MVTRRSGARRSAYDGGRYVRPSIDPLLPHRIASILVACVSPQIGLMSDFCPQFGLGDCPTPDVGEAMPLPTGLIVPRGLGGLDGGFGCGWIVFSALGLAKKHTGQSTWTSCHVSVVGSQGEKRGPLHHLPRRSSGDREDKGARGSSAVSYRAPRCASRTIALSRAWLNHVPAHLTW